MVMDKAIVYILINSKKKHYAKELIGSIRSVRQNGGKSANTPIIVYSDIQPDFTDLSVETRPLPRPTKRRGSYRFGHRTNKAHIYGDMPADKVLFLDTDVECLGDFSPLWKKCSPDKVWGIPDGRTPQPLVMIHAMFMRMVKEWYSYSSEILGKDYMESDKKPTAWNVGVLPMHREIGRLVSPLMLQVYDALEASRDEIWAGYNTIFDEQIPLNYALWKTGTKTGDLPAAFNVTKRFLEERLMKKSQTIFLHFRHEGHTINTPMYDQFMKGD